MNIHEMHNRLVIQNLRDGFFSFELWQGHISKENAAHSITSPIGIIESEANDLIPVPLRQTRLFRLVEIDSDGNDIKGGG